MSTFIRWSGGIRSPRMVTAALTGAWVLIMWGVHLLGAKWTFPLFFYAVILQLRKLFLPPIFLVTEGLVGVLKYGDTFNWAPLRGAELEWQHGILRIAWKERDRTRTLHVKAHPDLLDRTRAAARGADEKPPATPWTVTFAFPHEIRWEWFAAGVLLFMGLVAAAMAFDQPLFLLPMIGLPLLISDASDNTRYLLTPDGLWIARRNQEPVQIPLSDVQAIKVEGATATTIQTAHPDYPVIRLNPYRSSDLITRLRRLTSHAGG